ncbi:hypothetical protein [Streptomyces sp. NRRL B-24484]|uniref:hypothetical protein n=1 Tax=Streptomyces sp. NRRL B-24484 TaxID=1463833 RepID=UPI0004C02C22|nr:hypothetical protein [Streptomyces sp. NRRL B-24484]
MAGRLLTGGGVLLRRVGAWWTADGVMSGAARVIGTLFAVLAGGGLLLGAPALWWPLALGWLIASWYAQPAPAPATEQADPGEFLRILHQLLADRTGIHLAEVAEHLTGDPEQTAAVRELCTLAAVPINRGVRVKGRGVSTGIRAKDLPPLPTAAPDPAAGVVAAGQPSNSNSNAIAWIVQKPGGEPTEFAVEHARQTA